MDGWFVTKSDLRAEMAGLTTELADLRSEFKSDLVTQQRWFIGVVLASQALLFAALRYFG